MGRTIELTWVCSSCQQRNLGRFKVCQKCGNPKDASEKFEMPGDTRAAVSVVDPTLLAQANAGRDWRCTYCGSDQRRSDGACAVCGAGIASGKQTNEPVAASPLAAARVPDFRRGNSILAGCAATLVFSCMGVCGLGTYSTWRENQPRDAVVSRREWHHEVHVDRYRVFAREGFAESRPASAFDVRAMGQRHHHDEQVFDHMETVSYLSREQQGTETETYTEQVSCGEDCTDLPQSCHEVCSDNGNGFAECHDVCSGGGRSCTPRTCSETRTRQVPHFVDVPRTREEPRYRAVPRSAEWYSYRVWDWGEDRVLRTAGTSEAPRWPSPAEIHLGAGLGEGERERERRQSTYALELRDGAGRTYPVPNPSEGDFARYGTGSHHTIHAPNGTLLEVLDDPARRASMPAR